MNKTFCDVCQLHITVPVKSGYKLSLTHWNHTIHYKDSVPQQPCIDNLEMCEKCACNLYIHLRVLMGRYRAEKA